MKCDHCDHEMVIGDWPYCPHGLGNNLERPIEAVADDMIDYHGTRTFTTIGEKVRFMDRNAIVPKDLSEKRPGRKQFFL